MLGQFLQVCIITSPPILAGKTKTKLTALSAVTAGITVSNVASDISVTCNDRTTMRAVGTVAELPNDVGGIIDAVRSFWQ